MTESVAASRLSGNKLRFLLPHDDRADRKKCVYVYTRLMCFLHSDCVRPTQVPMMSAGMMWGFFFVCLIKAHPVFFGIVIYTKAREVLNKEAP